MSWKDKEKAKKYITERRRIYKKRLVEMMGGRCQKCGYSNSVAALEFHHPSGSKEDKISRIYNRGWNRILEEVKKTILICANCHREMHHGEAFKSVEAVSPVNRDQ